MDAEGKTVVMRRRNALSAKKNACGRFAVVTTSDRSWLELLVQYRLRNGVECDYSQIQSTNLCVDIAGKSWSDFLSLRLRLAVINLLGGGTSPAGKIWVPNVLNTLKMSYING